MKVVFSFILLLISSVFFAQNKGDSNALDITFFRGNVLLHTPNVAHLITGHPEGFMLSSSKKTNGKEAWQSLYNYPDYGSYFLYQDFKNESLGQNYAIGGFYNFYFLHRNFAFKVASGIAMTTNPHDELTNNKNIAFGSKFMGNLNLGLNYKKENILDKFGLQAGFLFTHFSNGRIKSPNSGINTYNFNVGLNYNFDENSPKNDSLRPNMKFTEPIKYNFVLRSGVNESPVVGSGQKPFYHISFYADKRINRKSALQFGAELFLTRSYIEYIKYRAVAFPEDHLKSNTDYKRASIFLGHELFVNRVSFEAQIGYYVYHPYKSELPYYDRIGMKYYLSNKIFTGVSLKTHGFLAEAMELVVGIRL